MASMVSSFSSSFSGHLDKDSKSALSIPHLTLRQLVYFAAAAEHESAVRAAEALNVSPPAISAAIACLEKVVGQSLFIRRHARGLVLTRAGSHLLTDSRDIIERIQEIEALCHRKLVRNRITVGCLGDISPLVIPPLVRGFENMYPEADVRWSAGEHEQLMLRLEESNLDVAIVLDFEIAPTLHTTVLRPTPVQCVLPPNHRLSHDVVSLSDLADEPFILLDMPRTRDYILSIFGDVGLQPRIAHRAPAAEMARSLVANGFGYSLLNFISASGGPTQNNCVYRPLKGSIRPSNLVAVRQYRRRPSQALERFVQYAQEMALASLTI